MLDTWSFTQQGSNGIFRRAAPHMPPQRPGRRQRLFLTYQEWESLENTYSPDWFEQATSNFDVMVDPPLDQSQALSVLFNPNDDYDFHLRRQRLLWHLIFGVRIGQALSDAARIRLRNEWHGYPQMILRRRADEPLYLRGQGRWIRPAIDVTAGFDNTNALIPVLLVVSETLAQAVIRMRTALYVMAGIADETTVGAWEQLLRAPPRSTE